MDFISNNWSQLTVIIGILSYIVKQYFNYRLKKQELNYKHVLDNRIKEFKEFYKVFFELKNEIEQFGFQMEFGKHDQDDFYKYRNSINQLFNEIELPIRTLRFYLSEEDKTNIDNLKQILLDSRKILSVNSRRTSDNRIEVNWDEVGKISSMESSEKMMKLVENIESNVSRSLKTK
jgi:hypothetical protein